MLCLFKPVMLVPCTGYWTSPAEKPQQVVSWDEKSGHHWNIRSISVTVWRVVPLLQVKGRM